MTLDEMLSPFVVCGKGIKEGFVMTEKILSTKKNGMAVLILTIVLLLGGIGLFVVSLAVLKGAAGIIGTIAGILIMALGWLPFCGLKVLKPQEALVLTLFGKYIGTLKGDGFFRAAYFLPNLIGGIVLGYIWQFVFNNVLINITKISWLVQTKTAMLAIVIVYIWQYAGYIMLIYITGLTQVPKDVLEAASIDGADAKQTLFQIKIPMIASTITICTFLTLTSAFKQFDVNLALTGGTGSVPNFMGAYLTNGTQMLALNIYNTAVSKNNYSLGQAKAVLFFIILACVSLVQVRISNAREVEL